MSSPRRTAMPVDFPMPWVDPRDIGEVVAVRLLSDCWSGRHVQAVHGPEDLSFSRVAEIVSQAVVRLRIGHQYSPDGLWQLMAILWCGEFGAPGPGDRAHGW
ncbi:MAG: hypothetical protein ACRDTF_14595 [Pseudonocardiaceae bacterium]